MTQSEWDLLHAALAVFKDEDNTKINATYCACPEENIN